MKAIKHWLFIAILGVSLSFLLYGIFIAITTQTKEKKLPENRVLIKRDGYGVPHIYAQNNYGLFYGYGHAVAEDRLFSMEIAKRSTQGRMAEILGSKYLEFDKKIRQNYSPESIQNQLQALSTKDYSIFAGYAAGINKYLEKIQQDPLLYLPKQFSQFNFMPEPWSSFDVAMIFVGSMVNRYGDFNTEIENAIILRYLQKEHSKPSALNIFNQLLPKNISGTPSTIQNYNWDPSLSLEPAANKELAKNRISGSTKNTTNKENNIFSKLNSSLPMPISTPIPLTPANLPKQEELPAQRSSAFSMIMVLGKNKTKGAQSLLLNGPQFGWFAPSYLYSVGLHGAGFDLVGNTPFAYPAILFGHNADIAWGSTWGGGDLIDIYAEKLHPQNKEKYLFQGSYVNLEKRALSIKVKNRNDYRFYTYRSVHGPIIKRSYTRNIAYAKKRSWEGREISTLLHWIESTKAKEYTAWEKSTAHQALNINMFYSDKHGNIGYVFGGKYPVRHANHDNRLPVYNPKHDWLGMQPFESNPSVYNPKNGYLINWNNRPAKGVLNPDVFWFSWSKADRVNFLHKEITSKERFTAEELWQTLEKSSFADPNISYFIPHLQKAMQYTKNKDLHRLAQAIFDWDGARRDSDEQGFYDSPGLAVFQIFMAALVDYSLKDDLGKVAYSFFSATGYATPQHPYSSSINLPVGVKAIIERLENPAGQRYDFFNGEPASLVLLKALQKTWRFGKKKYGSKIQDWQLETVPLLFRTKNFLGIPQNSKNNEVKLPVAMNRGSGNILVVFTKTGVEGYEVIPPGQSGFIASNGKKAKHYADQLSLYKTFQKKRMWLHEQDVSEHTESKQVLYYEIQ